MMKGMLGNTFELFTGTIMHAWMLFVSAASFRTGHYVLGVITGLTGVLIINNFLQLLQNVIVRPIRLPFIKTNPIFTNLEILTCLVTILIWLSFQSDVRL